MIEIAGKWGEVVARVLSAWIRALEKTQIAAVSGVTLPNLLPELASRYRNRTALFGQGETITYRGLAQRAAEVGGWASMQDFGAGQTVCLLMPNAPDYVAIWLGLSGVGCVAGLLNTNLRGDALLHCIVTAGAVGLIVGQAMLPAMHAIAEKLPASLRVWVHGGDGSLWPAFQPEPCDVRPQLRASPSDCALLIYTSGTTGLPKAVIVTHARVVEWAYWFAGLADIGPDDRMYDCLPLYHSVGGIIAVGSMLVAGGSVLIRARFSSSRFWNDVTENGCTILQYIGELCRYLLNAPANPAETRHRLRLACGNGLAPDIWEDVERRFALPHILEFYAATEGAVSLYNVEGRAGSIGRVPSVLQHRLGIALVKVDLDRGQPIRDAAGFCVRCGDDEPGEAIGRLGTGTRRFDGYTDAQAASAKVLTNAFAPGDRWFRTGDLLRRDGAGFYYFVDRLGDSFRWKGENVSTTEVAAVLRACPGVCDAAVYGVRVPGHDGRAGMAALMTGDGFDWSVLHEHLAGALPSYAQPLFVRLCPSLDATGTFKLANSRLAKDGFAPGDDPVWMHDQARGRFTPLTPALIDVINAGAWTGLRPYYQHPPS